MIISKLVPNRFKLFWYFVFSFLILSTSVRIIFFIWSYSEVDASLFNLLKTFVIGFLFDIGTVSFFVLPYALYLLFMPSRFFGSLIDRIITWFAYSLSLLIILFSFFAEVTFWEEFQTRFNFIAVDYLVYTNEVVKNINESYPIPLLLSAIILLLSLLLYITWRKGIFKKIFNAETPFKKRLIPTALVVLVCLIFTFFVKNEDAEQSENRYNNEISKTGIYSFFAAFQSNKLSYDEFYKTIPDATAFSEIKKEFEARGDSLFFPDKDLIFRKVFKTDSLPEAKPNIIFICVESLSADFLGTFGNTKNITPNLDSLARNSILFSNLYATGTRTVRGMEAITLSIPPTPGRSIVKRENNQQLYTIGEVFKEKGYTNNFFYGGDGYFDNMNTFFGGNGFNIIDRGRGFLMDADIDTQRINIEDEEVTFENAWGVADADIYNKVLKEADKSAQKGIPFFDFVMTTSNHRPYTFPEGKIDLKSGSNREAGVKYTDYAIGEFLKNAQKKSWYKNTVFIIMADHCASSAGRQELNVDKYHIPGMILNLAERQPQKITQRTSQIDVFPTLFSLLHWEYNSNFYGKNVLETKPEDERVFVGTYRKLGYLKGDKLMVLGDQKMSNSYIWKSNSNLLVPTAEDEPFLLETISNYQSADYLFTNGGLKLSTLGVEN